MASQEIKINEEAVAEYEFAGGKQFHPEHKIQTLTHAVLLLEDDAYWHVEDVIMHLYGVFENVPFKMVASHHNCTYPFLLLTQNDMLGTRNILSRAVEAIQFYEQTHDIGFYYGMRIRFIKYIICATDPNSKLSTILGDEQLNIILNALLPDSIPANYTNKDTVPLFEVEKILLVACIQELFSYPDSVSDKAVHWLLRLRLHGLFGEAECVDSISRYYFPRSRELTQLVYELFPQHFEDLAMPKYLRSHLNYYSKFYLSQLLTYPGYRREFLEVCMAPIANNRYYVSERTSSTLTNCGTEFVRFTMNFHIGYFPDTDSVSKVYVLRKEWLQEHYIITQEERTQIVYSSWFCLLDRKGSSLTSYLQSLPTSYEFPSLEKKDQRVKVKDTFHTELLETHQYILTCIQVLDEANVISPFITEILSGILKSKYHPATFQHDKLLLQQMVNEECSRKRKSKSKSAFNECVENRVFSRTSRKRKNQFI